MNNSIKDMMDMFKHKENSGFKYDIGEKTHLVSVLNAITMFPNLVKELRLTTYKQDNNIEDVVKQIESKSKIKEEDVDTLRIIIQFEKCNKLMILNLLHKHIINNDNMEGELKNLITSQQKALDYAVAIGIIDDYINFLNGKTFDGPMLRVKG